jgi:2-polyprenyl-3-methyl-5-hydroxy-6-metoxy-1,4-benzoquinol methylase
VNPITIETQEIKTGSKYPAYTCADCSLMFLEDYEADRSHIYNDEYATWGKHVTNESVVAQSKRASFRWQVRQLLPYLGESRGVFLDVGTGVGYLLDEAKALGFEVKGVDCSGYSVAKTNERHPGSSQVATLETADLRDASVDVVSMIDLIEHVSDPNSLLAAASRILKPGGILLINTPDATSLSRRLLRRRWFHYKYEHILYWTPKSMRLALTKHGFAPTRIKHDIKTFALSYYTTYFKLFRLYGRLGETLAGIGEMLPASVKEYPFPNPVTGEMLVIAHKK